MEHNGYLVAFFVGLFFLFCLYVYLQRKIRKAQENREADKEEPLLQIPRTAQQEDVWNISGRVNNQGATQNHPWPTHDNHVSIETIIVDPMKDMRPGYNDPPPSYEQAMSSASLRYDSLNVQAETTPTPAPSSSVATTSQQPNTPPEVVATTATRTEVSS